MALFLVRIYVFQHNSLQISGIITNFAVADRLAEAPVWGQARRDVVNIHKKAFIRADSCPLGILAKFILVTRIEQR